MACYFDTLGNLIVPMSTAYRIQLDLFNGPLDLLLYLVRRNEIDILELPVSAITAQFKEYLEVLEFLDLEILGDFVVMASSLLEIKSREALPSVEDEQSAEIEVDDDASSDLIQQLLAYKKYKDASKALEEQAAVWQERYPRLSNDRPRGGKNPVADRIKEVELWDLVSALSRILQKTVVAEEASIRYDDTPISVYIERIGKQVRIEKRVAFSSFFEGENLRSRIVGVFLAILELLRHHSYRAEQPVEAGEIWVLPPLDDSAKSDSSSSVATASIESIEKQLPRLLEAAENAEIDATSDNENARPDGDEG